MKLSNLYSDQPAIFPPIRFRDGLNVVLAHIRHPKDDSKIGHCLGKTLLIDILDFCLLKKVNKEHLFRRQSDLFSDFVFFLEIQLPEGGFLTIRRSAAETTKIAFKRHEHRWQNFSDLPEPEWDHWRETFDNAVVLLDSLLAFTPIKPWSYCKGLGYFLRGQSDYGNVFQLTKFGAGKHKDWKPYLARVLGFNDALLTDKYEADAASKKLQDHAAELQAEITLKPKDFDKLRASITAKRDEVETKVRALDAFDFHGQETQGFKDLQRQIDQDRAHLTLMETKAAKLESLLNLQDDLRTTKTRAEQLTAEIRQMVHQGSPRYHEIQRTFNRIIKEVLGRTALLYLDQNGEGNLDPNAEFSDAETDLHTEEDRGTSFRQLLCIAFDLAVLISYAKEPFFHFVYHDGGLERLQNKLKLALLRIIRETCTTHGIQYIFSALSEDLPTQEDTENLCPTHEEVILTLDDSGDEGRLFKMGRF